MSRLISSSDGSSSSSCDSSSSISSKNDEDQKPDGDRGCRSDDDAGETHDAKTGYSDNRTITLGRNRISGFGRCTVAETRPENRAQNGQRRVLTYNDIASGKSGGVLNGNGRSSNRTYDKLMDISRYQGLRDRERTANDSKKRYTTTGSGPNPTTTRYTRPSYTTNISSTPHHVSSSMSPALESTTGPDYKALYETEKAETTQLRSSITAKQKQLDEVRLQIEDTRKAYNSGEPDRRKGEQRLSECEEEMKILEALRAESEKLKAEHRALTRVVSHLM